MPSPQSPSDAPVFALADRFVAAFAQLRPLEATAAGIAGHDHRWGDLGPDGVAAEADLLRRTRRELGGLGPGTERWSRLATRVLDDELATRIEHHDHDEPLRDIAHLASTVPQMREALEVQPVDDAQGRDAVIARLTGFEAALAGWRRTVDLGRQRGAVVAARQVRSVADQLDDIAAEDGPLRTIAANLVAIDGTLVDRVTRASAAARTAAAETARWLREVYLPDAAAADGVGPERHLRAARGHLGTDLDATDAYAWGWERMGELTDRARAVARELGHGDDLEATVAALRSDPALSAPSAAAFRDAMQSRQQIALEALDGVHFDLPEVIRRVEVRLSFSGALGAYYTGPSEDFTRPGTIWWSLPDEGPVPLFEEVSTAYHEGFPGHHLQVGTQITLADQLSRAHRLLVWNPGYGEGWALYAEQLMDELGVLEHPAYTLGYLVSELLRATRVVVDIGLHHGWRIPRDAPLHPGVVWDHEVAVDVLRRCAFLPRDYAESEVTRYLGWPAQAISYALGQRAIVALRDERRRREGAAFDLKAFHADVLGSGPVGLELLRELVLDGEVGGAGLSR